MSDAQKAYAVGLHKACGASLKEKIELIKKSDQGKSCHESTTLLPRSWRACPSKEDGATCRASKGKHSKKARSVDAKRQRRGILRHEQGGVRRAGPFPPERHGGLRAGPTHHGQDDRREKQQGMESDQPSERRPFALREELHLQHHTPGHFSSPGEDPQTRPPTEDPAHCGEQRRPHREDFMTTQRSPQLVAQHCTRSYSRLWPPDDSCDRDVTVDPSATPLPSEPGCGLALHISSDRGRSGRGARQVTTDGGYPKPPGDGGPGSTPQIDLPANLLHLRRPDLQAEDWPSHGLRSVRHCRHPLFGQD